MIATDKDSEEAEQLENPIGKFPLTKIDVLIVGGGTAGLYFAIECVRQGHKPFIIEASPENSQTFGDFFLIGDSAIRNLEYWPTLRQDLEQCFQDSWLKIQNYNGEVIRQPFPMMKKAGRIIIRRQMQDAMIAECRRQNIAIQWGDKVVEYSEDGSKASVVLQSGKRHEADLVVACDGVHSRSWKVVLGHKAQPINTGYSIFRCSMAVEQNFPGPGISDRINRVIEEKGKDHDAFYFWLGPNVHANMAVSKDRICWIFFYKDNKQDTDFTESWANYVDPDHVIRTINAACPGWDEDFLNIVKLSRPIMDWRLMIRNPEPTWVSEGGRVVQVGDSAHPFLPTSTNGATQAMEDAVSLATCLRLCGGPDNIPSATRVHNKLRFERVSCSQLHGLLNRERLHKTDWTKPEAKAEVEKMGPGNWIATHHPEKYTLENFYRCLESLQPHSNIEFISTNIPPGYTFKQWDAKSIMDDGAKGQRLQVAGNWS